MAAVRAYWREPMLWLVVGIPVAVIIASIGMILLALHEPADATGESTRRIAQVQWEDLSWDREAARLQLRVFVEARASAGEVRVRLPSGHAMAADLTLAMRHPTIAAHDRTVSLVLEGDTWLGRTSPWIADQAWNIELTAPTQRWRVRGRLARGASHVDLVPQVAP